MTTNRQKQNKNYRDAPPAAHSSRFNEGGAAGRRFVEPPSRTNRSLEGRRSQGVDQRPEGPYAGGNNGHYGPDRWSEERPLPTLSPHDYEIIDDGYGNQTIVPMPHTSFHQHQSDYEDPYVEAPLYTADEGDPQIINIYNTAPQMGLVLSTVAITLAVLGLVFFWAIGGEGISRMASSVTTGSEAAVSNALVDSSTNQLAAAEIAAVSGQLAPFFAPSVLYWESQIIYWASQHNLDPNMVATVMQIESCGDPQAVSSAGATGLFQVMPFHFTAGEDMFDPHTNALRGMNYLAERLIQTDGDVGRAFAGYNGGHVAAGGSWDSWANETQRYFTWSTGIYDEAVRGLSTSDTLTRWYEAGGRSLCAQAEARLNIR